MKQVLSLIALFTLLVACDTEGVKDTPSDVVNGKTEKPSKRVGTEVKDSTKIDLDQNYDVVDEMTLSNGMKIKWFKHGDGAVVKDGDMIQLNYQVKLEDGTIIDAPSKRNLGSVPFMVGFQMQPSWDIALRELRLGDHVEVFIPYQLARGEKEIKGLMPAKSNNIVTLHIMGLEEPDRVLDGGTRVWMFAQNEKETETFGPGKRIAFHGYISSPSHPLYYDSQKLNNPFNYGYGEPGLVPGLKKALNNAKRSDLMLIHVPASQAYGNQGYLDYVKPNEDLFYRVMVMNVKDDKPEK